MITIGYSTRQSKPQFHKHLIDSVGVKNVEIIEVVNNGEKSLTQVYNEILDKSTNDIVVLCHDDIMFETKYWGQKLIKHFDKSNYGIIGVAGTKYIGKNCVWWDIQGELMGQVGHTQNGKSWVTEFNPEFGNKVMDAVVVDGVFISVKRSLIKESFSNDVLGFHFYDIDFCLRNKISGVDIGVISNIRLFHESIGITNNQWEVNRQITSKKFDDHLPLIVDQNYSVNIPYQNKPLVSVVMPIYNYGKVFNTSIMSVFDSTYENIELIIVNDGSTDDYVLRKLQSLSDSPNVSVIHQENKGQSAARNAGIAAAKGQYILTLDSDDRILPDYISRCVSVLTKKELVSPVYCDTIHVGEMRGVERRPEWSMEQLKKGNFIVNCSMFSKEAFDKVGGYDETLQGWEDYDLWIRMGLAGYRGVRIAEPLFIYFHHEKDNTVSTFANKNQMLLYKTIMEKNFKNEVV